MTEFQMMCDILKETFPKCSAAAISLALRPEETGICFCPDAQRIVEQVKEHFKTANRTDPYLDPCYVAEKYEKGIRQNHPKSFVYFITDGENFKVGKAEAPNERIAQLQTGNANELKLIALIPTRSPEVALKIEQDLHSMYGRFRVRGEWFNFNGKLNCKAWQTIFNPDRFTGGLYEQSKTT